MFIGVVLQVRSFEKLHLCDVTVLSSPSLSIQVHRLFSSISYDLYMLTFWVFAIGFVYSLPNGVTVCVQRYLQMYADLLRNATRTSGSVKTVEPPDHRDGWRSQCEMVVVHYG